MPPFLAVDAGTTNLRVWLVEAGRIVARSVASAGVRDTAREGHANHLHEAFRMAVEEVRAQRPDLVPQRILAAGMITSPLGLAEVPHVAAPAGAADLTAGLVTLDFPHLTDLPVTLVPGVKTLDAEGRLEDAMRGEETVCIGLAAGNWRGRAFTLLNLGSHWKAIRVDEAGRIMASRTSLTGELLLAIRDQTILSNAVAPGRPEDLPWESVRAGLIDCREHGLPRALFRIRLAAMRGDGTPLDRLARLAGVCLEADLAPLVASGFVEPGVPLLLAGHPALAEACRRALAGMFSPALEGRHLVEEERERAFVRGLEEIAA